MKMKMKRGRKEDERRKRRKTKRKRKMKMKSGEEDETIHDEGAPATGLATSFTSSSKNFCVFLLRIVMASRLMSLRCAREAHPLRGSSRRGFY